jgi:hypothetical protein
MSAYIPLMLLPLACLQRTMNWTWDDSLLCFTTTIEVEGTLVMSRVITHNSSNNSQEVTDTLRPSVNGSLTLRSKAYVGPGFSGKYNWSGELLMAPDPFAVWNLSPSALQSAAAPSSAAAAAGGATAVMPSRRLAAEQQQQQAAAVAPRRSRGTRTRTLPAAQESRGSMLVDSTGVTDSGSSGTGNCRNAAGSSSSSSSKSLCAAHEPLPGVGEDAGQLPSSSRALLQGSRSSSSSVSSSNLPVVGQVAVKEASSGSSSSNGSDIFVPADDDQTIIVSGAYIPGLGVPEACWGTVSCPVVYNPQLGLPESQQPDAANPSNSTSNSAAEAQIPAGIMQWVQMAGGLGGGLLLAALLIWLIVVFVKRAQQDEEEEQRRKQQLQQQQRGRNEGVRQQQEGQQQLVADGATGDRGIETASTGVDYALQYTQLERTAKSGQVSRRSTGSAIAAGSTSLVLTQQQQADPVQWLPGAATRMSVEEVPQLLLIQQQQAVEADQAAVAQQHQQQQQRYKPFTGHSKMPTEASAAAAVQAGNRQAVVSAQWALAGGGAAAFGQHSSVPKGSWDIPRPADGWQSMSTAVNLHGAAAGSTVDGDADAAAGRQQQRGWFGWLGSLVFGRKHRVANSAVAGAAVAAGLGVRPFRADVLHMSANGSAGGSRRARPGHATAAGSGSPASPAYPSVDHSTAVILFDANAAAAEAAAAAARAAAAGSSAAATAAAAAAAARTAWVGASGPGRQSLRRRVKLSISENSLMPRQASNGRQQQQQHSPDRPHSSSPVGGSEAVAVAATPGVRRSGRWFDSADGAAVAAGGVGAAASEDAYAAEVGGNGEDGIAAVFRPPQQQQQQQNRRSKAAESAALDVPVAGVGVGGLPHKDEGLRFSHVTQLRHRAELQE